MASLEKTTTKGRQPRYRVRWRVEGKQYEQWFATLEQARAHKTTVESDALAGIAIDPREGRTKLNDYFAGWIESRLVRGRPLTPATRIGYERLWRRNIEESMGRLPLRTIKPATVRDWYGRLGAAVSADQASKSYTVLRAVLNTALEDEILKVNPCRIRGAGQEHHAERPLVATSLVLDLADTIGERYRALVLMAGLAGLRTGELLGLRRMDVDLLHREVRVVGQAQEIAGTGRMMLPPKSDAGRRRVAIPSTVAEALELHLQRYTDGGPEAPVFSGPEGGPLRRATLGKAWRAAVKATGAPDGLRIHDLRHHAATLTARMPGVTTKELMARIGHASPRAALIYQHATAERDDAIAAFLEEQVAGAVRPKLAAVVDLG